MSDLRRHDVGASKSPSFEVRVAPGRWTIAVEHAVRPATRSGRARNARERILDALVQTVARRGYEATSIERVLAVAEVPQALFEEHFEGKQDCLLAALDYLVQALRRVVRQAVAGQTSWSEQIRLGLQMLLTALACNPDGARVACVEYPAAGEPAIARMRAAVADFVPVLEQGRAEALQTGHLPPQTSEAIVGGIAAVIGRHVFENRTSELPELLPDLLFFALVPYLGQHWALAIAGETSMSTGRLY
jgi:AcrR family transcriptional regulator